MSAGNFRLIVTGANGFIGRRLVIKARSRGFEVIALTRDVASSPLAAEPGLPIFHWEVGQPLPVENADALCHLAARIPPDFSDPSFAEQCFRINTLGTLELAEDTSKRGIGRFVLLSSGQVYSPHAVLADEDAPARPTERASYYLASKLAAEYCIQYFAHTHALPLTIIRPASVYGPDMKRKGIVQHFMRKLAQSEPVDVMDGGSYSADFVYVDDVADAILAAIERRADGVFNIGSGETRTALEVATAIADAVGARRDLIRLQGEPPPPPYGFAGLDIGRARARLGYKPRSFEAGMRDWLAEGGEEAVQRSQGHRDRAI